MFPTTILFIFLSSLKLLIITSETSDSRLDFTRIELCHVTKYERSIWTRPKADCLQKAVCFSKSDLVVNCKYAVYSNIHANVDCLVLRQIPAMQACIRIRGGAQAVSSASINAAKRHSDVIFHDNSTVYNLTKSGNIQMQHVVRGRGHRCPYRAVHVYVHFKGWLLSNMSLFNDTRSSAATDAVGASPRPVRITLGATGRRLDSDVEALAQAVVHMHCGGVARVAARAEHAYGAAGSPDGRVPPGADVLYELELLRFGQVVPAPAP